MCFSASAEGAFYEALNYTLAQTRPWLTSGVSSPREAPYILHHYGDPHVQLQAARLVTAKVITTRTGLDVVNRIFEVMGSRSTTASARLDRYWRNLLTQTLHDPVDYKLNELGDWALNHRIPTPTFYS